MMPFFFAYFRNALYSSGDSARRALRSTMVTMVVAGEVWLVC
jgi:hypothetical protein